jgi:hypothetical protein
MFHALGFVHLEPAAPGDRNGTLGPAAPMPSGKVATFVHELPLLEVAGATPACLETLRAFWTFLGALYDG